MAVSATLAANQVVEARRRAGLPVLPMSFGQAGIPVHPVLRAALNEAAGQNAYGPVAGLPALREAAAGYWGRRRLDTDPDLVLCGPGSKALLYATLLASGGDVALPMPCWVSYAQQAALAGRRAWQVPTPAGAGGVPEPELLRETVLRARAAGGDIAAVVLTLPDNPTGRLAEPATVRRIGEVARELDLLLISDEIYRDLVYRGGAELVSPAEVAPERTVVTTGLSKSLALGGWRMGVARFPDSPRGTRLRDEVLSIASEIWSSPAQPVQHAAVTAFTEPPELTGHVAAATRLYTRLSTAVTERFVAAGAAVATPQAAFYLYPDFAPLRDRLAAAHSVHTGAGLAELLLERHGVAVLPGTEFGEPEPSLCLRVATGQLTGADDTERWRALEAADPLALPWIAHALDRLSLALSEVTA